MCSRNEVICLFDVDGTLTEPRKVIDPEFLQLLTTGLKEKCSIGLVGGSDMGKIAEQLTGNEALKKFDYVFSENGLVASKEGKEMCRESIQNYLGEEKIQCFINFCLGYMSKLVLPVKRGTFIEFRNGLINVCPVGRSCTQEERDQFDRYDAEHGIRKEFVRALKEKFPDSGLTFSIGGQISFDVFPNGWDKTYCLRYLDHFDKIYFFGDKTSEGGNDYEIFRDSRTISHTVTGPKDTKSLLTKIFNIS